MKRSVRTFVVIVSIASASAAGRIAAQSSPAAADVPIRQLAYLKASNPEAHDHFGCGGAFDGHAGWGVAVSGDGNTVVVGAPHEAGGAGGVNANQNDNTAHGAGAAYVFARSGSTWVQQAYLKASNPHMGAEFGHAVAISGDGSTIAVSAFWEASNATGINGNQADRSIPQAGAAYVFVRRGTTWSQQAYVKASNTGRAAAADTFSEGDQFGASIALSDDGSTLAIGAISEDSSGVNDNQRDDSAESAGVVYVYNRTGAAWAQTAFIKAANAEGAGPGASGAFGDMFGYSVSLSADGRTLAVGAFDEDGSTTVVNGPPDNRKGSAGAVYVFVKPAPSNLWMQQAYIHGANVEAGDQFGVAVSISDDGNTLLVGSLDEDCLATGVNPAASCDNDREADISTGAAFIFVRTGTTWSQQAYLKPHNTGENDWFASRLALSGDGNTAAVPAPFEDGPGNRSTESGAVYLFGRTGTAWRQVAYVKNSNSEAFDQFGAAVGLSRDGRILAATALGEDSSSRGVNGNQVNNGAEESGAAYLFQVGAP
jgi:trimeric autotransporter adhesin